MMATISGRVLMGRDRSATIHIRGTSLSNIPIVLQNITTNVRLVDLTDAYGNYAFENVPDGDYKIKRLYEAAEGVLTPGDFETAAISQEEDPSIRFKTGLTNLDSATSDTLFVTVAGGNLFDQNFIDQQPPTAPREELDPADVTILKTVSPNPVNVGDQLTYTIQVANLGPDDAQNVVVSDIVPTQLLGTEYSTDGGATWSPWSDSYTIGTMPSGETRTILIRGTVDPSTPSSVITNTANITSTTPDPNPDNNSSTTVTSGNATPADLSVVKTSNSNPVNAGEQLT